MQRKRFITESCAACMGLMLAGLSLSSCGSALPIIKTQKENGEILRIPVTDFTDKINMLLVRNSSLSNDILLIKNSEGYNALYMRCTHEGVGLTATSQKIFCPSHGSVFDLEGNVVKEPALRNLKKFRTEVNNNDIIIHLT